MNTNSYPSFMENMFLACVLAVALALASAVPVVAEEDASQVSAFATGDTLGGAEAERFGLLRDVQGLRRVVFEVAPWGGFLARYEVDTLSGRIWRERSIPGVIWSRWQRQAGAVLAGRPLADGALSDSTKVAPVSADSLVSSSRIRVWPEVPLPPQRGGRPSIKPVVGPPYLTDRWIVQMGSGYKHPMGEFATYFTGMGMLAGTVGRNFGAWTPELGLEAGFGDIQDDFEDWYEDGRSFFYSITAGLRYSRDLDARRLLYCAGKGGYFMRSLQWGATFVDPLGRVWEENFVIEQQDWGVALRLGIQFLRGDANKSRVIDIGLEVQTFSSERWHYWNIADGVDFDADGRDWWLSLTVSLGEAN